MKVSTFLKPLSFIPALLLMYMIYSFSAQSAVDSSAESYGISRKIVSTVATVTNQSWDEWQIDEKTATINPYVRKGAHMTEYFLLAVAVSFPLYVYGVRGILLVLLVGLICVGYACGDEYHQSFVDGRGPSARDVGIDSIGVLVGIMLVRLMGWSARVSVTGPRIARKQRRMQEELDRREEELYRREKELYREEREKYSRLSFSEDTKIYDPYKVTRERNRSVYMEERKSGYPSPISEEDLDDQDSSDELSEDIPLFRRKKYRNN